MGTDYLARKQAKKQTKKARAEGRKVDSGRKERIGKPRKRLAGVCWGQPVLTVADKFESDDDTAVNPAEYDVLAGAGIGAYLSCFNCNSSARVPQTCMAMAHRLHHVCENCCVHCLARCF